MARPLPGSSNSLKTVPYLIYGHSRQSRTLTVRAVLEAKSEAWLLTVRAG